MSFLQPGILWAAPLVALPVVIHLLNRRRYQTVAWGATAFLIAADAVARGHARLRRWLVLAARVLALVGLLLVISRPLSSGWIGFASGTRVDTAVVLLDRSPSMGQRTADGRAKLERAVGRLSEAMGAVPPKRIVLIGGHGVTEVPSPAALGELPEAGLSDATTDFPALFERTLSFVTEQETGPCEVWVCSDLRRHDWAIGDPRWEAIRSRLAELPPTVRFRLLAYPQPATSNRTIRVTEARRAEGDSGPELRLSFQLRGASGGEGAAGEQTRTGSETIPVGLELDGARSELAVEWGDDGTGRIDQPVPLAGNGERGWGKLSIPSDVNPADNVSYFVYERPPERRTLIVTEDPRGSGPLELAASIPPDRSVACSTELVPPGRLVGIDWDGLALVLWQAPLPTGDDAARLREMLGRGGRVIFFPPAEPETSDVQVAGATEAGDEVESGFAGYRWSGWRDREEARRVVQWVGDRELLEGTGSGEALPVGELRVTRTCGLAEVGTETDSGGASNGTVLATLSGEEPLLVRSSAFDRNVYFCTTTTADGDSTFAENGIVLYAMVQRAAADGAASLGLTRWQTAGELESSIAESAAAGSWRRVAGEGGSFLSRDGEQAGVYRDGDRRIAVNRDAGEDGPGRVGAEEIESLFAGASMSRVDDTSESDGALVREVWRLFLVGMVAALLTEAALSLPRREADG